MLKSRFSFRLHAVVLLVTAPVFFILGASCARADESTPNLTAFANATNTRLALKKNLGVEVYKNSYDILNSPDIGKVPPRFLTHIKNTKMVFNKVLNDQYLAQADIFNVDQARPISDEGRRNEVSGQQVAIEISAMFLVSASAEKKSIFSVLVTRTTCISDSNSLAELGIAAAEVVLDPTITDDRLRLKAADTLEIVTRLLVWATVRFAGSEYWGLDMPSGNTKEIQEEIIKRAATCTNSWAIPKFDYNKRLEMAHNTCYSVDKVEDLSDYLDFLRRDKSSIPLTRADLLEEADYQLNQLSAKKAPSEKKDAAP